ncbi:beta-galactosidase subunit beta [Streptococcus pneumoniae]|uniref:YhcH/YjgK/YiaL family protein n=1 Tax=Streptococcus pneumoniae TaxID=1313 RepID=UPI000B5875BF|nr:YhcH/YjgK/YiaL family protein [Streptococcus pneumoniae]SNP92444.1 beta-galactosidase subunit beta [Streptococcus pneumoniae]
MIISEQSDFKRYASVNKYFSKVCDFLENTNLTDLVDGKIDIDGENVFANCMTYLADGVPGDIFETHKKYLDIHIVVENTEKMAVTSPVRAQSRVPFSEEKNIAFYDSKDYQIVELLPGNMLVTFEEDLHQPKIHCNDETVKKLVIKVLNEEK